MDEPSPRLLLGPILRYVDRTRATVWVETDRPCVVDVLGARERTWTVHGHHYALVQVTGLAPASETPYEVLLDDARVWPEPGSGFPPSLIRTSRSDASFRLSFGSCRKGGGADAEGRQRYGTDALVAMARGMVTTPTAEWSDALLLLGDQVYADDPSPHLLTRLHDVPEHHEHDDDARDEVRDFEGYTWLYHESWGEPAVRWLLSTVPSCMILDDHDLRDDWNTSWAWREYVTAQPWWHDRVTGAFASYWIYQHLGNLAPEQLDEDEMLGAMRSIGDDEERGRVLDDFARRSDSEPGTARWSFHRDLGDEGLGIRLVAVDARCSRRLDPADRAMLDDLEWQWVVDQAAPADGPPVDHLVLATTLPVLLLHGIHHLEGWNEAVARGAWGQRAALLGEHLRQAVDLEHWSAFRRSFDDVVALLRRVVTADRPPASLLLLSGDVHCSYTARAHLTQVQHPGTAIHQLTMSPFHNPMERLLRIANWTFEQPLVRWAWHRLARLAGVRDVAVEWEVDHGPWFDNGVMTVVFEGRRATVEVHHASGRAGREVLARTHRSALT